jgi:hypothetical protein
MQQTKPNKQIISTHTPTHRNSFKVFMLKQYKPAARAVYGTKIWASIASLMNPLSQTSLDISDLSATAIIPIQRIIFCLLGHVIGPSSHTRLCITEYLTSGWRNMQTSA